MSTNVNTDFNTALRAITQDSFVPFLQDNVYNKNTLLEEIKKKSEVTILDGGENIQVPLQISGNTNVTSFTGLDQIAIDPQKGFTDATYRRAFYGVSFPLAWTEKRMNAGKSQIVPLMASRLDQAIGALSNKINQDLYLDGTGNSSKDLIGFLAMIPSQTTSSTYAGIDGTATATSKWTHVEKEGAIANTLLLMDQAYYALCDGMDKPNLIVTDALGMAVYNTYLRAAGGWSPSVGAQRGDGSFPIISHLGIEIMIDQAHPQQSATLPIFHMLNTKYLGFYFYSEPMSSGTDSLDQFGAVYKTPVEAQLVTSNRRRQGKVRITS